MSKISFLVPHAEMVVKIKEAVAEYKQVHVEYCQLNEWRNAATKLVEQGYGIIIARAGTAARIRESGLAVKVVELPVTGFDIIRAVTAALAYGPNIAIVAHPFMIKGIECLSPLLKQPLKQYTTKATTSDDTVIEELVLQAMQEGADAIVGGGLFCQVAQKHGLPAVFIDNGKEAILQALEEAYRLQAALEEEKVKRRLFEAVLDYVHDGIVTVDQQQKITSINLRAQKIFNTTAAKALGQSLGTVWPGLGLFELIKSGQEELNKILQVKGIQVLCNKVPIIVNGKITGGLITLQEISKIQQVEAHIRKEIYNKGHVARKTFADILGTSDSITRAITLAKEFAATNSNILIVGETGTGKEVFAQSIHNHSRRHSGPFVAINCAALPAQLLESELFGYAAGAFTGASKEGKPGLFELAHGGTIFLDEISEMDYTNQSRLLRVLQERSVMRLGSDRIIAVDVRIIAATNRNLKELVRSNKFREDLFFRLNVLKLELPPLRERTPDIRVITEDFLHKYAPTGKAYTLSTPAIRALDAYNWPGNVRELQNTVERLVAFCQSDTIRAADITAVLEKWEDQPVKNTFYHEEIQEIMDALTKARGVQSTAAKLLGIDRSTLWRKMRKFGIHV